ncbi:protein spaetzle-like [Cydia splendana]|uniref:protein spaetzle-like n=1 Tax=Cydia splendana TaxID=1100963 RepID=UPI0028F4AC6C
MSPLLCLLLLAVLALTVSSQEFVPNVPEECLKTGVCEDLPDYPTERVDAIIEELGPALDKYEVEDLDASETLSRAGDEDQDLCESRRRTMMPRAARDKDGNWHYVLNQRTKPVLSFIVEICNPVDSPCANVAHFYTGYEASCKQKFTYRNSPTLDAGGAMVERQLLFPSCCSCQYRQTNE